MDLGDVLHAVRRGWVLLLGGVLLGLALAAALTAAATPRYATTLHLFVASTDRPVPVAAGDGNDGLDADESDAVYQAALQARERAASYAEALESEQLAARVVDRLGLGLPASELADGVRATVEPGTVVVELTVTDPSAARAQDVAAALAEGAVTWVEGTEDPVGLAQARTELVPVSAAPAEPRQVSPDLELGLGLGGALGFLLGLGLAVWYDRARATVATEADVTELTGAPLVGALGEPDRHADDAGGAGGAALLSNLALRDAAGLPPVVVVTGADRRDGVAAVVRALTEALVADGRRVAVVVADPRPGSGGTATGIDGLGEVLTGAATLAAVSRRLAEGRVVVVPPGNLSGDHGGLLRSPAARAVLDALAAGHDHVLVQSAPVRGPADALPLAGPGDGCLLAARYRGARKGRLAAAARVVPASGAALLGVVLTDVPPTADVVDPSHRYRADAERGGAVATRRAVLATAGGGDRS